MIGPGSLGFETYVYLTARAFTELAQQENFRTTEGVFCIERLKMQSPLSVESFDDSRGVLPYRTFIV